MRENKATVRSSRKLNGMELAVKSSRGLRSPSNPRGARTSSMVRKRSHFCILGLPLWEIARGRDPNNAGARGHARAIVAVGDYADGVIAVGGVTRGFISIGGVASGVFSLGGVSFGLAAALGGIAVAPMAMGGAACGIAALGGAAVGLYARGRTAIGSHLLNRRGPHVRKTDAGSG